MENEDTFILYKQNTDCWGFGDARNQCISRHGMDIVLPEYSGFRARRVNTLRPNLRGRNLTDIYKCIFFPRTSNKCHRRLYPRSQLTVFTLDRCYRKCWSKKYIDKLQIYCNGYSKLAWCDDILLGYYYNTVKQNHAYPRWQCTTEI